MRFHYSHNNGDAMFVIPPYPFAGEVENYNFFLSKKKNSLKKVKISHYELIKLNIWPSIHS
jgi:hypothetical protein